MKYRLTYKRDTWGKETKVEFDSEAKGRDLILQTLAKADWKIAEEDEEVIDEVVGDMTKDGCIGSLALEWEFYSRDDSWFFVLEKACSA